MYGILVIIITNYIVFLENSKGFFISVNGQKLQQITDFY